MRLGILISGRGSNMVALLDAMERGEVEAAPAVVVANDPDAGGLEDASRRGVPVAAIPHREYRGKGGRAAHEAAIDGVLREHGVDLVCLAGYMRVLTPRLVDAYPGRMLNIHPSLLPAFPGLDAQGQALAAGVRIAGCTVHYVDAEVDHGPIIAQAAVPVLPDDDASSLSARILVREHRLYPFAVSQVVSGRVRMEGGRAIWTVPAADDGSEELCSPSVMTPARGD